MKMHSPGAVFTIATQHGRYGGLALTVGWVSLILSPESKMALQQHITGFVTQSLHLGASPGAAGGGFYAPCPTRDLVSDAVSPVGPR